MSTLNASDKFVDQQDLKNSLTEILKISSTSLSTKEIRLALRSYSIYTPEHIIIKVLREILKTGTATFQKRRWAYAQQDTCFRRGHKFSSPRKTVALPELSPIGESILYPSDLSEESISIDSTGQSERSIETVSVGPKTKSYSGRWGTFRSLLAYYKECIRNEEGAEALAYLNEETSRYLYFQGSGCWYPKPGRPWRFSMPIGKHLSSFIENASKAGEGGIIVLGYPLQAVYIQKENEPDVAFTQPVFQFILNKNFSNGALVLSTDEARPEICLQWLKYAFSNTNQQRNFLSACGLINRPKPIDEPLGFEKGDGAPGLDGLTNALSAFISGKVREPLLINNVSSSPIRPPFETGIYNKAVIMLGKRTKYTKTLLRELSVIEQADDKILDSTALKFVFRQNAKNFEQKHDEIEHEAVIADNSPLNAEQRRAAASLVTKNVSVVTGPPGTGKSQVICSAIVNARLNGQTVLFSSRNHKAIDAVVNRLKDEKERPLIIRTNSKDDPSLNYNFILAIRDILANDIDLRIKENLSIVLKEIKELLKKRGENARIANVVQVDRDKLGELEQQMSFLTDEIPNEAIFKLDEMPQKFPIQAIEKIKILAEKATLVESNSTFFSHLILWTEIFLINPLWFFARRSLYGFPGLGCLPFIITNNVLKNHKSCFQLLSQSGKYANLKIESGPYIEKIKDYPPLEDLISKIKAFSERLSVSRAE